MTTRRAFIGVLGGAAAWPLAARAQQPERVRRVGVLMSLAAQDTVAQVRYAAFLQGLQQSGWEVGRNVRIETRWIPGNPDHIRKAAAELVALARCHPGCRQCEHWSVAASDALDTDRVRAHTRSGRSRVCHQHVAAWRECHWFHQF